MSNRIITVSVDSLSLLVLVRAPCQVLMYRTSPRAASTFRRCQIIHKRAPRSQFLQCAKSMRGGPTRNDLRHVPPPLVPKEDREIKRCPRSSSGRG